MGYIGSALAALASLAVAAFCIWRGQRPPTLGKVRYIPWMFIGLGFAALTLMFLTHIVNLAGVETGRSGSMF
ncbi:MULTISPECIES: hypothetical protein [Euryhalocaulis]|uniref:hypothetical protein n=1 Tax=Euryhalocaulis TaxID=1712422 RepID=UPI00039AFEA9|nr:MULTISPECIES: hypothetical protein [Euryhalocaulis]MBA4802305.1 hypothetical protein [Euryhalocaulis sp.]